MTKKHERAKPVRPDQRTSHEVICPIIGESGDAEADEGDEKEEQTEMQREQWEDMTRKVDDVTRRVAEYLDDDNAQDAKSPPMVKAPIQPTREEYERHQITHTPYMPWCKHCAAARAVRTQQPKKGRNILIVPDVDKGITGPTKISMDYMYLYDRSDRSVQANNPHFVVVEHKYGRVRAYQLPNKGVMGGAHWLPRRFINDWNNNGMKDAVIQLKTDQEFAMVNIQLAVQELRDREIIPINSPVGESECNGRVENAIRRVQEKTRALRHQIESNNKNRNYIMTHPLWLGW